MIVDDERDFVTLCKLLLERDGHKVTSAPNGLEALAILGVEPQKSDAPLPQIIIADVMMPQLDGLGLSSKLAENLRTRAIPLVMLTAKNDSRGLFERSPNVAAFLEKPFDPQKLRALLDGMLNAKP